MTAATSNSDSYKQSILEIVRGCQPCVWMRSMLMAGGAVVAIAGIATPPLISAMWREQALALERAAKAEGAAQANREAILTMKADIKYLVRAMEQMSGQPSTGNHP
jgi:hypothetical protein